MTHENPPPPATERYRTTEERLGTNGVAHRAVGSPEAARANLAWWDADAAEYLRTHGDLLGETEFLWCPEGWREVDLGLLGNVADTDVLEIGCGAAACGRWLRQAGARAVGMDLSGGMLDHAVAGNERSGMTVPLVQANAESLPFTDGCFDIACSAFGGLPFVPSLEVAFAEVARVLRPGGSWVFAVTHPLRWIFPDDPGPAGLTVTQPYFDRTPYAEVDAAGRATYVEYHRTLGDFVRALQGAGFRLLDIVEPEWPAGNTHTWGQWSPLRGKFFPGTAIFRCRRDEGPSGHHR